MLLCWHASDNRSNAEGPPLVLDFSLPSTALPEVLASAEVSAASLGATLVPRDDGAGGSERQACCC